MRRGRGIPMRVLSAVPTPTNALWCVASQAEANK
jgi:hypothetical protein